MFGATKRALPPAAVTAALLRKPRRDGVFVSTLPDWSPALMTWSLTMKSPLNGRTQRVRDHT
jgi:hypothetical protein